MSFRGSILLFISVFHLSIEDINLSYFSIYSADFVPIFLNGV